MATYHYLDIIPIDAVFLVLNGGHTYTQTPLILQPFSLEVPTYRMSEETVRLFTEAMRHTYPEAYKHIVYDAPDGKYGFIVVLGKGPLLHKYDFVFNL